MKLLFHEHGKALFNILFFLALAAFFSQSISSSVISYTFNTSAENNTGFILGDVVKSSSVLFEINTDKPSTCRYSTSKGVSYEFMEGEFDFNFGTTHKEVLTDLVDGTYKYYIKCKDEYGNESSEFEAVFSVNVPVSAQILLSKSSPLGEGKVEVKLITSKVVPQMPSLSYSFDGVGFSPIPLTGYGSIWKGYLIISDSLGEGVGSFRFQARDLEGNLGTEIKSGGIFIVDTVDPETIRDVKAVSDKEGIKINWHLDEEVDKFIIYRSKSPGVTYSDFYISVDGENSYFLDAFAEGGETYYYRVSAVDEAGNEGGLSREVSAAALLENTSIAPSGLDIQLVGIVDNFIVDIDSVAKSIEMMKDSFNNKRGKEKDLYFGLKLSREIDSAKSELGTLRREVDNFKSQTLTKSELNRKIDSARLKLNTIKKKVPENIIIISEKTGREEIKEDDITNALFEINPSASEDVLKETLKMSLKEIENGFSVETKAYNLEIVYLDGGRKEVSLIKEKIDFSGNENMSILEIIPKDIAESVLDIDIKNIDYDVLKEDTIISFSPDTKEIIYSIEGHINLNSVKKIKTLPWYEAEESRAGATSPVFTGYFSLVDFVPDGNEGYFGIIAGIIVALCLGAYFYFIKRNQRILERLIPIKRRIAEAEKRINEGDITSAREIYRAVSREYKNLGEKEKEAVYGELSSIHNKINWGREQ